MVSNRFGAHFDDLQSTENLIRNIQANDMSALVRVEKNEEVIIKKVLDMGADGIVVPMVCSKEDALEAVSYAKYPPGGNRGVGLYRHQVEQNLVNTKNGLRKKLLLLLK